MQAKTIISDFFTFSENILEVLPNVSIGIGILTIFFLVSKPIANVLVKPLEKGSASKLIQLVVRRSLRLIIILLGFYILLSLSGLTKFAVALLSGTGVLGLIVGFAFKDIAENFLSSLLLSVQRPFKLGDIIEVQGYLGVVKKMTARATTLVDFNGDHIQLPNAAIYKNAIRNLTANPNMRTRVQVGVGYDVDIDQAQSVAMQLLQQHPAVLNQPEPQILLSALGSSTCNLDLYFWVNSELHSQLKVASVIRKRLVNAYMEHGFSMPDDARERIIINSASMTTDADQHQSAPQANKDNAKQTNNFADEDTSSDHNEIRALAAKARDPEEGMNIL